MRSQFRAFRTSRTPSRDVYWDVFRTSSSRTFSRTCWAVVVGVRTHRGARCFQGCEGGGHFCPAIVRTPAVRSNICRTPAVRSDAESGSPGTRWSPGARGSPGAPGISGGVWESPGGVRESPGDASPPDPATCPASEPDSFLAALQPKKQRADRCSLWCPACPWRGWELRLAIRPFSTVASALGSPFTAAAESCTPNQIIRCYPFSRTPFRTGKPLSVRPARERGHGSGSRSGSGSGVFRNRAGRFRGGQASPDRAASRTLVGRFQ
mmetsp:Transcript_31215/g.78057  ORF Transcript_31215/g.78057 Transcript_31215/m.78057 type:complete len:266 (-) Transcript_31215:2212-3009(-)